MHIHRNTADETKEIGMYFEIGTTERKLIINLKLYIPSKIDINKPKTLVVL